MSKNFHVLSKLLIPAPQFTQTKTGYRWIDSVTGQNDNGDTERVEVFTFNTESKTGIKSILERNLQRLYQLEEPEEIDVHNMVYLESLIREIEAGTYTHDASAKLLETVNKNMHSNFAAHEVIYLAGVAYIG